MKFIGHLDIMRYFQKAMRRAEIDICYSEGFSPHQIMSFAAPLGVGITSDGEYLDIEVNSTKNSAQSIQALNDTMVEGIEIIGYVQLPEHAKTAMSIVAAADYELSFKEEYEVPASLEDFQKGLEDYFQKPKEVLITKQTKKSEKVMDLKQLVYHFTIKEMQGRPVFYLMVSTGSSDNLKPELVLESLFDFMGLAYDSNAIQIHRKDVYAAAEESGKYISLGDMGEKIL
jgi:radical SAM-linked protein